MSNSDNIPDLWASSKDNGLWQQQRMVIAVKALVLSLNLYSQSHKRTNANTKTRLF
jgi:hypothetical protein